MTRILRIIRDGELHPLDGAIEAVADGAIIRRNRGARVFTDIGAVGGSNGVSAAPAFFNRRSTVSLSSSFGEVRLGRDYNPSNWHQYTEAYGGNGFGGLLYMVLDGLGSGAKSFDDNAAYTPAWQESITGVPRDQVITVARQFADNAD